MMYDSLQVNDIVDKLGVTKVTVRRWIRTGKLKATKRSNRAGYYITLDDFDEFLIDNERYWKWYYEESENYIFMGTIRKSIIEGLAKRQEQIEGERHHPVFLEGWNEALKQFRSVMDEAFEAYSA